MPTSFLWFAADRRGRLARFTAERGGTIPRAAALDGSAAYEELRRALHAAWLRTCAPQLCFEARDLQMIPESTAPHLVAFAGPAPSLRGAVALGERVLYFERPTAELRELVLADDDADEPLLAGSLAVDLDAFGEHVDGVVYRFSNRACGPLAYERAGVPHAGSPLLRESLGVLTQEPVVFDVDFATLERIEPSALLGPDAVYELGGRGRA